MMNQTGKSFQAIIDMLTTYITGTVSSIGRFIEVFTKWVADNPEYAVPAMISLTGMVVYIYIKYNPETVNFEPLDESLRKYKNMYPTRTEILDPVLPGAYDWFKEHKKEFVKNKRFNKKISEKKQNNNQYEPSREYYYEDVDERPYYNSEDICKPPDYSSDEDICIRNK